MDLREIELLAERELYDKAVDECNKLIIEFPEEKEDIYRTRAYIFSLSGEYNKAVQERKAQFNMGIGNIQDYYLGADDALSAALFMQASTWFKEVLRMGKKENETWFESGSCFLLAYSEMKLENYQEALNYINRAIAIEPDCAMPLTNIGMCTSDELRREITRKLDICGG